MDSYDRSRHQQGGGDIGQNLSTLGNGLLTYIKTRSPDHWLFFALGIIAGLLIAD